MRLLIDSDVFCKLGVAGLLTDALTLLDVKPADSARLPALPHMLRRGRLPKLYGIEACAQLLPVAEGIPVVPAAEAQWLDRLASVPEIDPGEVQLFAAAAQFAVPVLTGDKRAIRAVRNVAGFAEALAGLIVIPEVVLIGLCHRLGATEVGRRISTSTVRDVSLEVCFSPRNTDPVGALESYWRSLAEEARPLELLEPTTDP